MNKLLLDTHSFLWWLKDPSLLSDEARRAIADARSMVYVSAASIFEASVKRALGKLSCPSDLCDAIAFCRFEGLPFTIRHAAMVEKLPLHHKDPFDRLLIAQSLCDDLTLVTRDGAMQAYGVSLLKA